MGRLDEFGEQSDAERVAEYIENWATCQVILSDPNATEFEREWALQWANANQPLPPHISPEVYPDEQHDNGASGASDPGGSAANRQGGPIVNPTWNISTSTNPSAASVALAIVVCVVALLLIYAWSGV